MSYYADFEIKNLSGDSLYVNKFTKPEDYAAFVKQNGQQRGWGPSRYTFVPVRTDKENYLNDLFRPNYLNTAPKVHKTALDYFKTFLCAALDLVTLPIRLVASPFRYFHKATDHPLKSLVQNLPDVVMLHTYEETPLPNDRWNIDYKVEKIALKALPIANDKTVMKNANANEGDRQIILNDKNGITF